jgi:hypothetical protein
MHRFLRALALVLLVLCAGFAPFALLPLVVRWPSRREDAIVELAHEEDSPVSPAPHLDWRRS